MITAKDLAIYILIEAKKRCPEEKGMTLQKLQALLYYCQGYSLALTGKSAFEDKIEARDPEY